MPVTMVPTYRGNVEQWAGDVAEYLRGIQNITSFTSPQPVLLAHQLDTAQSATYRGKSLNGLLMFDPTSKTPLYSRDGVWEELHGTAEGGPFLPLTGGELTGNLTLENTVALRLDDSGGSPQVGMRMTGTDVLQVGEVNVPNMELIAASAGTIEFYCGTANIDARVSSSKFESFGGGTLAFEVDAGDMWVGGTAEIEGNVTFNARMISAAAGSLGAPSIEFQGNTTTWGLDTTSGDDFRISRAGSNMLSLNSTGSTILSDFSATDGTAYAQLGDQGLFAVYRDTTSASGNLIRLYSDVNAVNTEHFQVKADGDVLNTNNSYGAISDARLKENIADVPSLISDYMQLRVRRFNLIADPAKTMQIGLIAQEVYPVQPRLVSQDDESGYYNVKYSLLGPMTVKVVQEVITRAQALSATVDTNTSEIARVETQAAAGFVSLRDRIAGHDAAFLTAQDEITAIKDRLTALETPE